MPSRPSVCLERLVIVMYNHIMRFGRNLFRFAVVPFDDPTHTPSVCQTITSPLCSQTNCRHYYGALKFVYFYGGHPTELTNTDVLGRHNRDILSSCKSSSQKHFALKTGGKSRILTEFGITQHILKKFPNIKFDLNPSMGSRVDTCGQTDGHEDNKRFSRLFERA